jgi:hypothetical protein
LHEIFFSPSGAPRGMFSHIKINMCFTRCRVALPPWVNATVCHVAMRQQCSATAWPACCLLQQDQQVDDTPPLPRLLSLIMSRVDPDDTEEGANVDTTQLSTRPRHARSQHSASVTDASVTMQGGHFGVHIPTMFLMCSCPQPISTSERPRWQPTFRLQGNCKRSYHIHVQVNGSIHSYTPCSRG